MSLPAITPAPSPVPIRSDFTSDALYSAAVDAWMAWWVTQPAEYNALGAAIFASYTADNYNGASASSVAIGSGSKAFNVGAGKIYQIGQWIMVASAANPANFMTGPVASYSGSTLTLTVPANGVGGSGTYADWILSLSGPPGFSSGWVQIGATVNLTSGVTVDFTGLKTSAAAYTDIQLLVLGASHNGGGARDFTVLYGPDGTNWSSAGAATSQAGSALIYGGIIISNFKKDGGLLRSGLAAIAASPGNGAGAANGPWRSTGGVDAMRLALSGDAFDAGTAQIFARA